MVTPRIYAAQTAATRAESPLPVPETSGGEPGDRIIVFAPTALEQEVRKALFG